MRDRILDLLARAGSALGKGPGLVGLAYLEAGLLYVLAYVKPESNWTGIAMVLGAVNAGVYGGGAYKAGMEAKHGNGNGKSNGGA